MFWHRQRDLTLLRHVPIEDSYWAFSP
jgi:hypothetical protein